MTAAAHLRTQVKLCETQGYARDPSPRPGVVLPWRHIGEGRFEALPADVRELQARRGHHAAFALSVLVACAAVVLSD